MKQFLLITFFFNYSLFIYDSFAQKNKKVSYFINSGDRYFEQRQYFLAVQQYEIAFKNSANAYIAYRLGECCWSVFNYYDAEKWFGQCIELDSDTSQSRVIGEYSYPLALFWYAMMQKSNGKYVEAKENFKKFTDKYKPPQHPAHSLSEEDASVDFEEQAKIQYEGCVFALEEIQKPIRDFQFRNIGSPVNSDKSDYGPVIFENDSSLVITSARKGATGKEMYKLTGETFSDNYRFFKNENGWKPVDKNDGFEKVNTARNDGTGVFTKDKMKYFFSRCNEPDGNCAIYVTELMKNEKKGGNDSWSSPKRLNNNVNKPGEWNAQPALSANDDTLFFVSKRPGGYGMHDIWYCVSSGGEGGWSEAKNIGASINTPFIDISPHYYPAEKALFFASNGHIGFGGLDIFIAKGTNFQEVKNIGLPFNSNRDDFYLVMGKQTGYLSSNREGGLGNDDIYVFNKTHNRSVIAVINTDPLKGNETISIEGRVLYNDNKQAAKDVLVLIVNQEGFIFRMHNTDSAGRFKFKNLPPDQNFTIYLTEILEGEFDLFAVSKYRTDDISIKVFSEKGKFGFVNPPGEKVYKLDLTEGQFLTTYEKFVKDTTKLKINELKYVILSSSDIKKIDLMIDRSNLTADRKYIIDGITIGQYNEKGAFVFTKLTPDEIKKLSTSDVLRLTANGKFIVDGAVLGEYDKENNFHFTELSADELTRLRLTEEQVHAERKIYSINNIKIGIFDKGKFKFVNLSADVINKIGLIDKSKITADKKYIIDGITIGEFDKSEIFIFKNLTPNEIARLSSIEGSNITADGKYMLDGIVIGHYDEKGVFSFINLTPDEISRLRLMEDTVFVALLKKFVGNVEITAKETKIHYENIYFDYKLIEIRSEAIQVLTDLIAFYNQKPGIRIEIYANTDNTGSDAYNIELSQKRGLKAMEYLISEGISKNDIIVYAMGESKPIASNETEIGQQLNRRVQFNINTSPSGEIIYHIVEEKNTLKSISEMYHITVNELKAINGLTSDKLKTNQKLIVIKRDITAGELTKAGYVVKKGDSIFSVAKRFELTIEELKAMNNIDSDVIFQYMILKVK